MDDGAPPFGDFRIAETNREVQTTVRKKRKYKRKKKEYNGWGSTSLIRFLESIGRDTTNKITQSEVTKIINEYVKQNNLLHPTKKKRIECDDRLHLLFGRKSIGRLRISDLLESHFVENCGQSNDDFSLDSEDDEYVPGECETLKLTSLERKCHPKKHVVEKPRSCFVAINPFNIKLVYLKRSLVEGLLKEPETFQTKVVGSFIRIKCDPNDYLQKNSHQLLQITGIKKSSGMGGEIRLQASGFIKDISINMLSDDNFSEAECEDLHRRVKDGLLKRPMIVDLEEKARVLHEDMTKHWLAKEIALLENLIDQANEKGWRRELDGYLQQRAKLKNPKEQERLLNEIPQVIAEDLESECTTPDVPDKKEETNFQELSQTTCTKALLPTEVPKVVTDDFDDDYADEQEWLFHDSPQVTTGHLDFSESKTPEVPDKKEENNIQEFSEATCTKESLVAEISKMVANGYLDFSESKTPEVPDKKKENNMQRFWEASTKESLVTEVSKTVANGFASKATKFYAADRTKQESELPKMILSPSGPSKVPLFNMAMNSTALNHISRDTITSAGHQWSSLPVHQQPAKQTDSAYKKDGIYIPVKSNEVMINANITQGPSKVPVFNMAMNNSALNCFSRDTITSAVHQWSSVPVHQQPAKQTDSAYKKDGISIPVKSNEVMISAANITRGPMDKQFQVIELSDGQANQVTTGYLNFSESKTPEVPDKKAANNMQGFWEATCTKESLVTEVSKAVANGFAGNATKLYAANRTKQESELPKMILSPSGPSKVPLFNMAMNSTALNCISRDTITSAVHRYSGVPVHQQPAKQTDSAYKKDGIPIPAKLNEVMINPNITQGPSDKQIQVIELSDDEEEEIEKPSTIKPSIIKPVSAEELQSLMWHYKDPQGKVRGPFPIISLKVWSDARYFSPDFKVWKAGQSQDQSVLLVDILPKFFPLGSNFA